MWYVSMLNYYLLKSPVKCSVFFHDFTELVERSGTYALDVAACECRLEHICCVQTSGCPAGSYNSVEFVYK